MDVATIRGYDLTATKRSLAALLLALTLFINVYKPQEHEQHAESPTVEARPSPEEQAEAAYVDDKLPAPKPVIRPDKAEQPKAKPVQPVSTVQPSQPAPKPAAKPATYTYEAITPGRIISLKEALVEISIQRL